MSVSKHLDKLLITTLAFLFLLSTIGKVSKFSVDEVYEVEVSDDEDEYRRAAYDGNQVQLSRHG